MGFANDVIPRPVLARLVEEERLQRRHDGLELPEPECPFGYSREQVQQLVGEALMPTFHEYMNGQTQGICDGRVYNPKTKQYEPSACADNTHGIVTYSSDLRRFLQRLAQYGAQIPPLD